MYENRPSKKCRNEAHSTRIVVNCYYPVSTEFLQPVGPHQLDRQCWTRSNRLNPRSDERGSSVFGKLKQKEEKITILSIDWSRRPDRRRTKPNQKFGTTRDCRTEVVSNDMSKRTPGSRREVPGKKRLRRERRTLRQGKGTKRRKGRSLNSD